MDIGAIRTAIADALAVLDIHAYDYVSDQPLSPAAFVYPDPFAYHWTFDDGVDARFIVRLLVSSVAMQSGQQQLDAFLSDDSDVSVVLAIEADTTLAGTVTSCQVTNLRNYGVLSLPDGLRYLSAELVVSVYAA